MSTAYRPEIDGFRALAVTVVVLFHAGAAGFSYGFIGVDVFFVISGFLITGVIVQEREQAGFHYGRFVMRRVRRILPALVVVMLTSVPFAWWLMLPDQLENFGQSLVATAFSANNILLWLTTGYWNLASDYKPLLHTWSLGVEEQFYIFYPFLLIALLKLRFKARFVILGLVAVLSFAFMALAQVTDVSAAFYLLHFRAWQLLTGGLVNLLFLRSKGEGRAAFAWVGLGMIVLAMIPLDIPMTVTLLLATLGSALYLLHARAGVGAGRIFILRPVIFVGLVSYSFYLWHQPVFAFIRVGLFDHPGPEHYVVGIAVAFALAVLSWRYVERPFRSPKSTSNRQVWAFVGPGLALIVALGLAFHVSGGAPQRLGYSADEGASGISISYNERIRHILPQDLPEGAPDRPVVVIAGNSFSRDFSNVLLEAGLGDRLNLIYREDLSLCWNDWSEGQRSLVAGADMLVFASGAYAKACLDQLIEETRALDVPLYIAGPKSFGENLNPLVRYSPEQRSKMYLDIPEDVLSINAQQAGWLAHRYLDVLTVFSRDGRTIRVANDQGVLLTTDTIHLSQAGAVFMAERLPGLFPAIYELAAGSEASGAAGN